MMHSRRPMRLLLREHGVCGGTETVNVHLIKEFIELVDRVVWVMPEWRFDYFQQFLPPSDRLVYQSSSWPGRGRWAHTPGKAIRRVLRPENFSGRFAFEKIRELLSDLWL